MFPLQVKSKRCENQTNYKEKEKGSKSEEGPREHLSAQRSARWLFTIYCVLKVFKGFRQTCRGERRIFIKNKLGPNRGSKEVAGLLLKTCFY